MNTNAIRGGSSPYELFTMVYHKDTGRIIDLIRARTLLPMDAATLLFLATKVNVGTSRISVGPSYVAESMGISVDRVQSSLKRLRANFLVGKGLKDGVPYYMLNPHCFHAGHTNAFCKKAKAFRNLFEESEQWLVDKSLTPL